MKELTVDLDKLVDEARKAQGKAYAPYSGFRVGAALLCSDGRVFTGSNVENAVYGLSICAERAVVVKAVTEGCRDFEALAVVADSEEPLTPCGTCRQFLYEFKPDLTVVMVGEKGALVRTVDELLPNAFTGKQLKNK